MGTMPNGGWFRVREQILRDGASGLTLQFEALPGGLMRLRVFGVREATSANEIVFDEDGEWMFSQIFLGECPRPGWIGGVLSAERPTGQPRSVHEAGSPADRSTLSGVQ